MGISPVLSAVADGTVIKAARPVRFKSEAAEVGKIENKAEDASPQSLPPERKQPLVLTWWERCKIARAQKAEKHAKAYQDGLSIFNKPLFEDGGFTFTYGHLLHVIKKLTSSVRYRGLYDLLTLPIYTGSLAVPVERVSGDFYGTPNHAKVVSGLHELEGLGLVSLEYNSDPGSDMHRVTFCNLTKAGRQVYKALGKTMKMP